MRLDRNIALYILVTCCFIILKFAFTYTDNDSIRFLTKPTNTIVELFANSSSIYCSANGYIHPKLNIVIDRSCSGYNYWILCFIMFSFLIFGKVTDTWSRLILIPIILFFSYFLTIFVNSSRILTSIFIESLFLEEVKGLHQAEGVLIYSSFLILFYLVFNHLLNKRAAL